MVIETTPVLEREVFGVTYERYALQRLFSRLAKRWGVKSILEVPASGAKAMPSLYSLGWALAGCQVALVDADAAGLDQWRILGLQDQLTTITSPELRDAINAGQRWDLAWNFAVLPTAADPLALLRTLRGASRRWVLLVHVNRFNYGFFLHRTVHRLHKIPWNHGNLQFFSPFKTCDFLRKNGIKRMSWGVVDCPPWPDSPGFRDLRLHRQGSLSRHWVSPYVDILQNGKFPSWFKWVYTGERLPMPALFKLPYAHLFYAFGLVDHEAQK